MNSKGSLSARTALECQIYFGWHWDVADANGILMASKADDAGVDLSLWNVGGDAPGMEQACRAIRSGLHAAW